MFVCFKANKLSLENKFSNLKTKLSISSPLKQYSLALHLFIGLLVRHTFLDIVDNFIFPLRIYLLAFFSQHTSSSIIIESKQSSLNVVYLKKSPTFSFEPCALNLSCCEIHILRYNYKSHGCFTFRNSHSKSPGYSNQRDYTVFS